MVISYKTIYIFQAFLFLIIPLQLLSAPKPLSPEDPYKEALASLNRLQHYIRQDEGQKARALLPRALRQGIQAIAARERRLNANLQKGSSVNAVFSDQVRTEALRVDSLKTRVREIVLQRAVHNSTVIKEQLTLLLQEYKGAPFILVLLAEVYARNGEYDRAKAYYSRALTAGHQSGETRVKLARVCRETGDFELGLRLYQSAAEQDPENGPLLKECIAAAEKCGHLENLAERWGLLVRAHPEYEELKKHLIAVWHKLGRNDKVTALLNNRAKGR